MGEYNTMLLVPGSLFIIVRAKPVAISTEFN